MWGKVTLSQQNQPSPPAAVPAESTKCSAKRGALEQGMDSESSSHLQTQPLPMGTLHCALHHSRVSEEDVLMAPRKWIKALLDSIASSFSKLALRHALQLVRDV